MGKMFSEETDQERRKRAERLALHNLGRQQAEWAKPKPLTTGEIRSQIEELQLETAELRKSSRRDMVWVYSVLAALFISLLLALFGME